MQEITQQQEHRGQAQQGIPGQYFQHVYGEARDIPHHHQFHTGRQNLTVDKLTHIGRGVQFVRLGLLAHIQGDAHAPIHPGLNFPVLVTFQHCGNIPQQHRVTRFPGADDHLFHVQGVAELAAGDNFLLSCKGINCAAATAKVAGADGGNDTGVRQFPFGQSLGGQRLLMVGQRRRYTQPGAVEIFPGDGATVCQFGTPPPQQLRFVQRRPGLLSLTARLGNPVVLLFPVEFQQQFSRCNRIPFIDQYPGHSTGGFGGDIQFFQAFYHTVAEHAGLEGPGLQPLGRNHDGCRSIFGIGAASLLCAAGGKQQAKNQAGGTSQGL